MEDPKVMDENPSPNVEYPKKGPSSIEPSDAEESYENHSSDSETIPSDDVELPSNVTDRKRIFMPLDLKPDDPRIHGKWLWFSNGDIYRQDDMWVKFANLILQRLVILNESSTVKCSQDRGRYQGVIKCYTAADLTIIKEAGLAIQRIVDDGVILHYKTNKASADSKNRTFGDRFISEYMLTVCGGLYSKDELKRWRKVEYADGRNSPTCAEPNYPDPWSSITDISAMPSKDCRELRYVYPNYDKMKEVNGSWTLFCRINGDGCSELDRVWMVAKRLFDDGVLLMASCETLAAKDYNLDCPWRRSVHCMMKDCSDVRRLICPIDRLRKETNYDFPVYFKSCHLIKGKLTFISKYLYTDERELYEYLNESWQLVARGDISDEHA